MSETRRNDELDFEVGIEADLRQRHMDAFFKAMNRLNPDWRGLPFGECVGDYARAGIEAGMVLGMKPADVADLKPAECQWLALEVDRAVGEALQSPPA